MRKERRFEDKKLIITIDTEEDNWGCYDPNTYTIGNIERIPGLQQIFDDFNAKPTYLITYPVAISHRAISILKPIYDEGRCEIGAHCHAWNTPPFENGNQRENSMLSNLPVDLQFKKIKTLHETIQSNFGIDPLCFRSGRWGYSATIAGHLKKLGYKIDTSITPYIDWRENAGPDYTHVSPQPYRFSCENIFEEAENGELIEIPATIGFLQKNFTVSNFLFNLMKMKPFNRLRLIGVFHHLNLLNKVWLSPEFSNSEEMIRLTRRMMRNGYQIINMVFHSSSLQAGLTPFVKTAEEERKFLQSIKDFLSFTRENGIESIKMSDAVSLIE
jgi:hypothetical protein